MQRYDHTILISAPSGFYWAKRGDSEPRIIWVSNQSELMILDFGYRQEIYIYKNVPTKSDYYSDVVLFGSLTPPIF